MKFYKILFLILIVLVSCKKQTQLQKEFNCKTNSSFSDLEKIDDFKNKFSLQVPSKWATKLFYNNHETNIMTADSLKSFTKTYILDVSLVSGDLQLNEYFTTKTIQNLVTEESLVTIKHELTTFKDMPAIWFLSVGKSGDYKYHYFQLFAKNSPVDYFKITTKIYGDELIDERLCESIALMQKLDF